MALNKAFSNYRTLNLIYIELVFFALQLELLKSGINRKVNTYAKRFNGPSNSHLLVRQLHDELRSLTHGTHNPDRPLMGLDDLF